MTKGSGRKRRIAATSAKAMTIPRHHLNASDILLAVLRLRCAAAGKLRDDASFANRVDAVRNGADERQVLLDQRERGLCREVAEHVLQLIDHARCKPFSRLVHEQHLRAS